MRTARDTFLHFLADNLTGVTVHPLRYDANDPSTQYLQGNAVNVQFLNMGLGVDVSEQQVVIDVLNDDENTVVDWIDQVATLLKAAYFTPLQDYSDPTTPVMVGGNLMWDRARVQFRRITSDQYCQYSCTLQLRFHEQ